MPLNTKHSVQSIKDPSMVDVIKNRQTEELVIALCGPVGSGTSTVALKIEEIFCDEYKYKVHIIKISKFIKKHYGIVMDDLRKDTYSYNEYHPNIDYTKDISEIDIDVADRILLLQSAGNILRIIKAKDILVQLSINEIVLNRMGENDSDIGKSIRHVTIIDSLKNPEEVELLQLVYGDMFFLFGVLCPEETRLNRLVNQKRVNRNKVNTLVMRDKSDGEKNGQQMLKTIILSDFFVTNIDEHSDSLKPNLERYLKIMMGNNAVTPLMGEIAMFHAYSASVKSGCMARQVGASIIDEYGNILSTGCNDVPKPKGGLYTAECGNADNRCMFKYGGKCKNDEQKDLIFAGIKTIIKNKIQSDVLTDEIMKDIEDNSRVKNLIEFCRAIHAEMDAIISVVRSGSSKLKGSSLYCTTYPCHNCAKHIVATGIAKVYYIEPYEKSLAPALHDDSIDFNCSNTKDESKTWFIPFEGVGPKKFLQLFHTGERKLNGVRVKYEKDSAKPNLSVLLDSRTQYESKIVENLQNEGFEIATI